MRLIDADELEKTLQKIAREPDYLHEGEDWSVGVMIAQSAVIAAHIIEAEPVKHGRWVKYYNSFFGQHQCFCSECEGSEYWKKYYCYGVESYCPNCGAKMDLEG